MSKIIGRGAPTSNTFGILGQEYLDELTGIVYRCVKSRHVTGSRVGEADQQCEWAPEGSGSPGGSGLSIKKIEFTDRPALWEWLKNNYTKVTKSVLEASLVPIPLIYNAVNVSFNSGDGSLTEVNFSSFYPIRYAGTMSFTSMFVIIDENETRATLSPMDIQLDEQSGITLAGDGETALPDLYWSQIGITVTIYYIDENVASGLDNSVLGEIELA